jgi:hypothetical protein
MNDSGTNSGVFQGHGEYCCIKYDADHLRLFEKFVQTQLGFYLWLYFTLILHNIQELDINCCHCLYHLHVFCTVCFSYEHKPLLKCMFNADDCVLLHALITRLLHGRFETDYVICRELMYEIFIRDSGMNELSNALLGHIPSF